MAKVLIVTSNYWPEPTGVAVYTFDLASILSENGYLVTVLTGIPHYPWWRVPEQYQDIRNTNESKNGIQVQRVRHYIPSRVNTITRIRFELSLWWHFFRLSNKQQFKEYDAVISVVPSLAAGVVGLQISKKWDKFFGVVVQDLTGIGVTQSGHRGGKLISRVTKTIESSILFGATSIVTVSPKIKDFILGMGIRRSCVELIRNYSAREIKPLEKISSRQKFGWSEKDFLVIHSGNMGRKQDLGNVIEAAKNLRDISEIKIFLVGHGNQEKYVRDLCKQTKNVFLFPAVSHEDYPALLASADLLLLNERSTQMEMSLPSKLTSYLYSNRPILAAVPKNGASWNFLDGLAELVESSNPTLLANTIKELSHNSAKRKDFASKGLAFAIENLNPEIGRLKYLCWVESLIQSNHG